MSGGAGDSEPIGELAARARALAAGGDLAGAAALLGPVLSTQDPDPAAAPPAVAEAAAVYARILAALHENAIARSWAAFAHRASVRLFGPADERTLGTAATLATVLHRAGALHRAAHLYQELIDRLSQVDGPESARALAARADLATVLHARGECRDARRLLHETWMVHSARYGEADPAGIKMLARLGSMERACGDLDDGAGRLAEALRLSRGYLGEAHSLTAQVAALAEAPPKAGHICSVPELPSQPGTAAGSPPESSGDATDPVGPSTESAAPAGSGSTATAAPEGFDGSGIGDWPRSEGWSPTEGWPGDEAGGAVQDRADEAPPAPATAQWPASEGWSASDGWPPHGSAPPFSNTPPPAPSSPPGRPEKDENLDEPWWPEDAFAPTQPPIPEPDPRVWTAEPPRQVTDQAPPPRFGRLAAGTANPVLVGLVAVIAGTLAAAAVGYAMSPRGGGNVAAGEPSRASSAAPAAPTTPPPTTPAPTPAPDSPGPPTGVKLTEGRESVTVTWRYPAGAEGPVVISGGRAGQPMQAFATLPAGTTRYTIYGLAKSLNYCFRVAVAHSTDVVARADPVCTHRR
ncbi:tetratricopeptide repeat protein [Rhizomonospora bruguierae]|uniref:tetratricopeptide repeat protein n=1 Tax=Rhizomonospora bruguierae TaxID=1581705 RepID=UPI001BCF4086|nr:tetratricopeptide repeat protein [Micromonospora sp. NBRC 107566]